MKLNRVDYLSKLEKLLNHLPKEEKDDILYDYEEHFRFGIESGKSEGDIASSLGSPESIAKQYRASYMIDIAEKDSSTSNIFRAIFAIVSLGFFNIVFVLGPFVGIVGGLIGLFAASIAITIAGMSMFVGIIFKPLLGNLVNMPIIFTSNIAGTIFLSIGITALGVLFFVGISYLGKFIYKLTIKYLKFNLNLIKK